MLNSNSDWNAILTLLLSPEITESDYTLNITDEEILIQAKTAKLQQLQEKLKIVMASTKNFLEQLPYQLTQALPVSNKIITMDPPEDTVKAGTKIFTQLFSEDTIDDLALSIPALFREKKGASAEKGILYSCPVASKEVVETRKKMLEALLTCFNGVSAERLKEVLTQDDEYLPEFKDNLHQANEKSLQGLVQRCFGIIETAGKIQVFFNYGLLYRMLFPPTTEIISDPNDESMSTLHINKEHFNNYLLQVTQGGCLLRVYRDTDTANSMQANPLFIGQQHLLDMPKRYVFIIDKSGSVGDVFKNMKQQILAFTEKLRNLDQHAEVRMVFFSTENQSERTFQLSEETAIKTFVGSQQAYGYTPLFNTTMNELTKLLKRKSENTTVVLFTDGMNTTDCGATTYSHENNKHIQSIKDKLKAFNQKSLTTPKFFTLGLGYHYDFDMLSNLASATNSPFIHLKNVDDFAIIEEHARLMSFQQKIMKLIVNTGTEETHIAASFHLDGNVQASHLWIPFGRDEGLTINCNGSTSTAKVDNPATVPVMSANIHLQVLASRAHAILANDDKPLATIKSEIAEVVLNIKQQQDPKNDTTQGYTDTLAIAENYQNKLKNISDKNSADYISLVSQAKIKLGYKAEVKQGAPVVNMWSKPGSSSVIQDQSTHTITYTNN